MQSISGVINLSNPKRQDNRVQNISNVINLSIKVLERLLIWFHFQNTFFKILVSWYKPLTLKHLHRLWTT